MLALASEVRATRRIDVSACDAEGHYHFEGLMRIGPAREHTDLAVEVFKFEEGPEAIASRSLECLRRAIGAA